MPLPHDLPTLVRGVNSRRPFDAFFSVALAVAGAGALWYAVRFEATAPAIVVGVIGLGGAVLQLRTVLRPSRAHPGIRALLETPDRIVWWYILSSGPRHRIRLRLDNGKIHDIPLRTGLPLVRRNDTEAAVREIAPRLRHATAGYTYEHDKAYRRDPSSLRKPESA